MPSLVIPSAMSRFVTNNLDAAHLYMTGIFQSHQLEANGRRPVLDMRYEGCTLGAISFHWLRYGGSVHMTAPALENSYLFQCSKAGSCELTVGTKRATVRPGDTYAIDSMIDMGKTWSPDADHLIMRIDRHALELFAAREIGDVARSSLGFKFEPIAHPARESTLAAIVCRFRSDLESGDGLSNQPVSRHLQPLIMSLVLSMFDHQLSRRYERAATELAPASVRRAEDYIRAHFAGDLDIAQMAAASGVSIRSLFNGFRQFRSTTPMQMLKSVRLEAAYRELILPQTGKSSVTDVALRCGFTHMSKFARDFQIKFGLSPSAVLGKNRSAFLGRGSN